VSLLSSVTHLYILLYPFLLQIFWSCHIVCTAVFRVIIISCHTFVYTSVPILVTNILELSYCLYGCISCHYYQLSYICLYLCTHSCYKYSGVVIEFLWLYLVSLLSSIKHLYIPLYPFLLHIFWSCHIVCTAVFRVIIISCHTFIYTSVPIPVTNILELSYSLYAVFRVIIIICHTFVYASVPILVTHILELSYSLYGCISCHYFHLSHICIYLCTHSCYTYSGVVILFVRLYFVSLLSSVTHLYIPLYPFLLQIFWSCHIVCTAVFRVIIIICHTFVYTSVPILATHILELSYSLYGCISCHYYHLSHICIYLCTHPCYTYSGVVI
jgi:hypothetical protein